MKPFASLATPTLLALSLLTACAIVPSGTAAVDGPPNTDIYLAELSMIDNDIWLGTPQPLAVGAGYDNQPAFLPGGNSVFYTSAGPSGKTDLWQRDLVTGRSTQITNTPERSEYSPRLAPDAQAITFIQENPAGDVTEVYSQALPRAGTTLAQAASAVPVIALKPLGYYAYIDQGRAVLTFLRDEPASLQRVDTATGEVRQIASNIGRALYAPAGRQAAFFTVARQTEAGTETFQVNRYDNAAGQTTPLFDLKTGVQDYAVFLMPDQLRYGFFCAQETRLYFRTDRPDDDWRQVADLYQNGFTDITRLAVNDSATRIALVTQTKP